MPRRGGVCLVFALRSFCVRGRTRALHKDITGLVERLNELEDNQTINPFELGMLDTLDEG